MALGLLLGGALGNMVDRFRLGYVIDWVDIGIGDLRFYTFNVADSAIMPVAILLLLGDGVHARPVRCCGPDDAPRRPGDAGRTPSRCLTRPIAAGHPHRRGSPTGARPGRPVRGRRDRPVAEPRPEADHRRPADRRGVTGAGQHDRRGRERRSGSTSRSRSRSTSLRRHDIELRIVYEDDDLLIVDKPAGLVVHPSPGHHDGDTLVNALLARAGGGEYGGIAGVARPGIVHRLDRDTSGLLMVAKHDAAQASLMAQLKARRVRKTYLALVAGQRGGRGRPDRGADRARPEAPHPDGRGRRRPARPRPATGSGSGSPAGPCSSSTS